MDYRDRSYFNVLLDKVKTVINKTGAAPWYEPPLFNKGYALTTEEVNDNFQALAAGEINLNERTKDLEDSIVDTAQNVAGGSVKFNGFQEKNGCMYGGKPFNLLAATAMDADPINLANPLDAIFKIAEGNSISYIVPGEINDGATKWYTITVDFAGTKANLVTYLNEALVNNRTPYRIEGVDLSSPGERLNWGDSRWLFKNFSISFNDEEYKSITLNTNCGDTTAAAIHIRNQIVASWPQYADCFTVTSESSKIRLTAISNVVGNRLTRVRVKENAGQDVLGTANGIGWIVDGSEYAIFDFSNSLEFYLSGSYMGIRGNGSYSHFAIKDGVSKKLFPTLKLDAIIRSASPFFQTSHTPYPTTDFSLPLSYAGIFYVGGLVSAGDIIGPINAATATIGTLNVTTLNAATVNIPNSNLTLQVLRGKGFYVSSDPDSVLTNGDLARYNALDGGIYVEGTAELVTAAIHTANVVNLNVTAAATFADASIDSLSANKAVVSSLTVSGGSLNVTQISANSISSSAVTGTTVSAGDLIITKTARAAGRFYTTASGSAASADTPTNGNNVALMSYDGWFRATAVYAGSTALTSARAMKKEISPYTDSALEIINSTDIVNFIYKNDLANVKRVGFIADDTHELLATPNHDNMDVGNSIGLLLKAVQELSSENKELRTRIMQLETN